MHSRKRRQQFAWEGVDLTQHAKLYEAYSDLHRVAQKTQIPIHAPIVTVVGHQTDGKSGASNRSCDPKCTAPVHAVQVLKPSHANISRPHNDYFHSSINASSTASTIGITCNVVEHCTACLQCSNFAVLHADVSHSSCRGRLRPFP